MKIYLRVNLTERKVSSILACCILVCLLTSCKKRDGVDCYEAGSHPDLFFIYDTGALKDSSLSLFPDNLPSIISFKNNFNQLNTLWKNDLKTYKTAWTYFTETMKEPCYEYKKIYKKSVPSEIIEFVPISQPNFYHSYTRTRYIEFQNYQNLNSKIKLDSNYEILTITLTAPLNIYYFIVPIGDIRKKLTNYTYFDTLIISGVSFNNIYHIYSDSSSYDTNKIVPQGLYYNPNHGLVGYYLSNGELWVKQ